MPRPKKGYEDDGNPDETGFPQGNEESKGIPPEAERLIARAKGQKARNHQGKGIPQGKGESKGIRALVPARSFRGIPYRERLGPWGVGSPLQMQAEREAAGSLLVHDPGDPSGIEAWRGWGQGR